MAINFDHSNSSNVTLRGPSSAGNYCVYFPAISSTGYLLTSGNFPFSAVSGLTGQLDPFNTFKRSSGSYSAAQWVGNTDYNVASGQSSVALGSGALAIDNYEVAHSAGFFAGDKVGSQENRQLVLKCSTFSTPSTYMCDIGYVTIVPNSINLVTVDSIGKAQNKYAAFKVESVFVGAATGQTQSSILEQNLTTYANTNDAYFICIETGYYGNSPRMYIKVSGDAVDAMKWVSYVNISQLQSLS